MVQENVRTPFPVIMIWQQHFDFEVNNTYTVKDGVLTFDDKNPKVDVHSKFGNFDISGDIDDSIEDGLLVIQLKGSNDTDTFDLARFELGKKQADLLKIKGVTAEAGKNPKDTAKDTEKKKAKEVVSKDGAVLSVESAGNKISFYPDQTFQLISVMTRSDSGMTFTFTIEVTDQYSVQDGNLVLPENVTCIWNSDIFAQYGKTDVESPGRCSVSVVNGLLELHFYATTADGESEIATFQIGKEDAEKIGVKGISGETVHKDKEAAVVSQTASRQTSQAPVQQTIARDAKPVSFSDGSYQIVFYSNGQYQETGSVNVAGQTVNVNVTDTYSFNNGELHLSTAAKASCSINYQENNIGFGANNITTVSSENDGLKISFTVDADGKKYFIGSVTLSASDIKRLEDNYGQTGEKPEQPAEKPSEKPSQPSAPAKPEEQPAEPSEPSDDHIITLKTDSGLILTLNADKHSYEISGKTIVQGIELVSYSLKDQGQFTISNNDISFSPCILKIHALNPMAARMEGEYPIQITAAQGENHTLAVTLPVGNPAIVLSLTSEQAETLGLDMEKYGKAPETNPVYTAGTSDITFDHNSSTFDATGSGKFVINGMEADLSFHVSDSYSESNGAYQAANTKGALAYTLSYQGQTLMKDAPADPDTKIVKDGDHYRVTVMTTVNNMTITLCEGSVPASDVEPSTTQTNQYVGDPAKTAITFDHNSSTFAAAGSGKFVINGMEADLSFHVTDSYSENNGAYQAANTKGALAYTLSFQGQTLEDAPADPDTKIVKDGDQYNVTVTTAVNGMTITLCEGSVPASDVEPSKTQTNPYVEDPAKTAITFDHNSSTFDAAGGGKFVINGVEADLSFNVKDSYSESNSAYQAANTKGALVYTLSYQGQTLMKDAPADPDTKIVKDGDHYRVTVMTTVNGETITLCEGSVPAVPASDVEK